MRPTIGLSSGFDGVRLQIRGKTWKIKYDSMFLTCKCFSLNILVNMGEMKKLRNQKKLNDEKKSEKLKSEKLK